MVKKIQDLSLVSYTLGIVSIVMSIVSAYGLAGIIFGIIGLKINKNPKTDLAKKAKKLNTIGIIIGVIIFIASIVVLVFFSGAVLP